jgi:hypothetical protein
MNAQPPVRRPFQHSFPYPQPSLRGTGAGTIDRYRRLMRVAFRNDYYPPPFASPDFIVHPTAETESLLRRLGLLFRAAPTGFAILYDTRREKDLLGFLRQEAIRNGSPRQPQAWSRLSFVLRLAEPRYVNFTRLPLDFNPSERNFYFSNRAAHRRGTVILLNRGDHVKGDEILNLVFGQLRVPIGPRTRAARVLAISGETVLHQGRASSEPALFLDFSLVPEGHYLLQEIGPEGILAQWELLSSGACPVRFAFIDLLLARPRPGEQGIYPVRGLWKAGKGSIRGVDYELFFRRRSTIWRYFIVLPRGAEADGLEIESLVPPDVRFSGPVAVNLDDGTPASGFVASRPLPLQAHPDVRLRLRSEAGILLDPLPVASSRQVLPAGNRPPSSQRACSDVYVYV